jgi:hypothetical protein
MKLACVGDAFTCVYFHLLDKDKDGDRNVLLLAYGLDQVNHILDKYLKEDPNISLAQGYLSGQVLPSKATRAMSEYDGPFISEVTRMMDLMAEFTQEKTFFLLDMMISGIVCVMGTNHTTECDLIISYCGTEHDHYITVVSSWQQIDELFVSLVWLEAAAEEKVRASLVNHQLPVVSEREPITIEGDFARLFNYAVIVHKKSQPKMVH